MIALTVLTSGCAAILPSSPDIELGREFAEQQDISTEATQPHPLPSVKEGVYLVVDGVEYLAYDEEASVSLERYIEVAEANTTIAEENAQALTLRKQQINELLAAGRLTEQQAALLLDAYKSERRDAFLQRWFSNGVLVLLALAAVL